MVSITNKSLQGSVLMLNKTLLDNKGGPALFCFLIFILIRLSN